MWRKRNFYRDLWGPAQKASGLDIRLDERAQLLNPPRRRGHQRCDLAEIVGHQVEAMLACYAHVTGISLPNVRWVSTGMLEAKNLAASLVGAFGLLPARIRSGASHFARRALYPLGYERTRGQRHSTVSGVATACVRRRRLPQYRLDKHLSDSSISRYIVVRSVRESCQETALPHPDAATI